MQGKRIIDKFNLKGRTAVVTGSSRGIGRSIAIALAEQGADIVINYRTQKKNAEEVYKIIKELGGNAIINKADLTNESDVRNIFDETIAEFGKIDILILNASMQIRKSWDQFTAVDIEQQISTNFSSSYNLIKLAMEDMKKRDWGRILTIGSNQESKPYLEMLIYAASKCAQTSLVRTLAAKVAKMGITINNLAPGIIITDRNRTVLSNPEYNDKVLATIPSGFFGDPDDCASLALLLCSEAGRYINGESIYVDGGVHL